ncbi:MAG: hypothetical protein JF590_04055 [Gemmatimonadetes bacterium]|nr:hypothetical protein [Gemmatimonadota bacterium]
MRRALLLLSLLLLAGAAPALGQGNARVHLALGLTPDSTGRTFYPKITTVDLIADPRVGSMLASGFPVRLHYRLELYRSRSLVDAFVRQTEWDLVIRHEPLLDQYQVAEVFRNAQRLYRYAGKEELLAGLAIPREVRLGPRDGGEYYFVVTLEVSTLSDSDIKELEQFLSGDVGPAATGSERVGSAFTNAIRRVLLTVSGLPSLSVDGHTEKFTVQ